MGPQGLKVWYFLSDLTKGQRLSRCQVALEMPYCHQFGRKNPDRIEVQYWGQKSCRVQPRSTWGHIAQKCSMATKFCRMNPWTMEVQSWSGRSYWDRWGPTGARRSNCLEMPYSHRRWLMQNRYRCSSLNLNFGKLDKNRSRNPIKAFPEKTIPLCCTVICQNLSSLENINTPQNACSWNSTMSISRRWHLKGEISQNFRGKMHYLGSSAQKLKAAYPVNYFSKFLGKKNPENCPPSKLF